MNLPRAFPSDSLNLEIRRVPERVLQLSAAISQLIVFDNHLIICLHVEQGLTDIQRIGAQPANGF